ncbi:MAG TPA: rhodanese-like domain-containing protein [Solirubrobacteraceae bacterium]|nr:rhodanese-like domain-containing protein [Solirubrobacteraceae bacterium]
MSEIERSPEDVARALADGSATVVDVREPHEREEGFIAGSEHIPLGDLGARAQEIARDRPVAFYCHVGARSLMAAEAFARAGYDAFSMAGGIEAWEAEGRPVAH